MENCGRAGVRLDLQSTDGLWQPKKAAKATLNRIKPVRFEATSA